VKTQYDSNRGWVIAGTNFCLYLALYLTQVSTNCPITVNRLLGDGRGTTNRRH